MKPISYRRLEHAGRLGNQLFQIAATIGLAATHHTRPLVNPRWSYRPFFSLPEAWYSTDPRAVDAPRYAAHLDPREQPYLQDLTLFDHVAPVIRRAFTLSDHGRHLLDRHLVDTDQTGLPGLLHDAIAVHVRRGDNTDLATHPVGTWPVPTPAYYRNAVDHLDPCGDHPLVVFSDEPEWCAAHLDLGRSFTIVHSGPTRPPEYGGRPNGYAETPALDWIDLALMAMAPRHVLSNSTYGWWGAWLSGDPTAVYPTNWTGFLIPWVHPERIMPPSWTMVDNPVAAEHLGAVSC